MMKRGSIWTAYIIHGRKNSCNSIWRITSASSTFNWWCVMRGKKEFADVIPNFNQTNSWSELELNIYKNLRRINKELLMLKCSLVASASTSNSINWRQHNWRLPRRILFDGKRDVQEMYHWAENFAETEESDRISCVLNVYLLHMVN